MGRPSSRVVVGGATAVAALGTAAAIAFAAAPQDHDRATTTAHVAPRHAPPADAPAHGERSGASASTRSTGATACPSRKPVHEHTITRARWVRGFSVTEYYSSPERWFTGRMVRTPGLPGRHRVDWLYSSRGVAMEGDGIGLDGRHYHIDALGSGGWVNVAGHHTNPGRCASRWSRGRPVWLQGGWRNPAGEVTFPLAAGGWSNGPGGHKRSHGGATFAPGSSLALHAYRTLAVDPRLIPRGSRVYIPYYKHHGIASGWFVAQDTGGAIIGRHVDVYRPPTATPDDGGRFLQHQRVYVVPPSGG